MKDILVVAVIFIVIKKMTERKETILERIEKTQKKLSKLQYQQLN